MEKTRLAAYCNRGDLGIRFSPLHMNKVPQLLENEKHTSVKTHKGINDGFFLNIIKFKLHFLVSCMKYNVINH